MEYSRWCGWPRGVMRGLESSKLSKVGMGVGKGRAQESTLTSLCDLGHVSLWFQFPILFTGRWVGESLPLHPMELSLTSPT